MSQTSQTQMICTDCRIACRRFGKHRNGLQRFRCADCGTTYTEAHAKPLGDMTISLETDILALKLLIEATARFRKNLPHRAYPRLAELEISLRDGLDPLEATI